jgi:flagellar basal-body rod protein FlgF/flagellar basal-body rod protein FlgG
MDSGLYAVLTGWVARSQALDLAANNLANVSTTGFKAEREFYRSFETSAHRLGALNRAVNDYGVLGGASIDLHNGSTEKTGNDLDVALEGSGFLVAKTSAGERYTRDGNLSIGPTGLLVTSAGDPVLGEEGPIQIPNGKISISPDGTLSSDGAIVAKLRLVDFAPGAQLTEEGHTYFAAPNGSEQPASSSELRQGFIESSNLNPVEGAVNLIELQRQAGLLQRALAIFHNDFNRTAVQELPSVQ